MKNVLYVVGGEKNRRSPKGCRRAATKPSIRCRHLQLVIVPTVIDYTTHFTVLQLFEQCFCNFYVRLFFWNDGRLCVANLLFGVLVRVFVIFGSLNKFGVFKRQVLYLPRPHGNARRRRGDKHRE